MKKSELSRALLQNGLTIRPQALDTLANYLTKIQITSTSTDEFEEVASRLAKHAIIDITEVEALSSDLQSSGPNNYLVVLNVVRELPHFVYSPDDGDFAPRDLAAVPDDDYSSVDMMQERLLTIKAVLKANKLFEKSDRLYAPSEQHIDLITVDALVGSVDEKIVLGILTRLDEKVWILEDSTGFVKLSLSSADPPSGYFPSGSIVIVQGEYQDGLLNVRELSHPPIVGEMRSKLDLYGTRRYLELASGNDEKVVRFDTSVSNMRFVLVADVHLDCIETLEKLTTMFSGYERFRNLVFILMGDFLSTPTFDSQPYELAFNALSERISQFSNLRETCYWILVPGPNDVGLGALYPKDSLPESLTYKLRDLPHFISASNPAHIDLSGKRMTVFATDFVRKLRRNTAVPPSNEEHDSTHLVQTVLRQAHLLPGREVTTMWELDHAMRLFPLPNVLCYADKCESFVKKSDGCLVVNPASFTHDSTFIFLNLSDSSADECSL